MPAGAKAVFFCYRLPAEDLNLDPEQAWRGEAGRTGWYLLDLESEQIKEDATAIAEVVRSSKDTPRIVKMEPTSLREARLKIEKHIKNNYLKQVQAPIGVKPELRCWMEIN